MPHVLGDLWGGDRAPQLVTSHVGPAPVPSPAAAFHPLPKTFPAEEQQQQLYGFGGGGGTLAWPSRPHHLPGGLGVVPRLHQVPAVQAGAPVLLLLRVLHVAGVFGEHVFPPAAQDHLQGKTHSQA